MAEFLYLIAQLKTGKLDVKLDNPTPAEIASQLQNFSHLISSAVYYYSPVDYEKIRAFVAKAPISRPQDLAVLLKSLTPTKILEIVKPFITLQLLQPTDESQVKKWKEKIRALEQIAISAYLHALFVQVFPQNFKQSGSPSKAEVRLAANMSTWKAVKKVDCKTENKEIFASLCAIYHAVHVKLPAFTPMPAPASGSERKSYSALVTSLSSLQLPSDATQAEWLTFATFNAAGFPPIPSAELVGELYPEFKVSKPRGNFGKKKK